MANSYKPTPAASPNKYGANQLNSPKVETINSANLLAVILAGGTSRRMGGGDKFLRPIAGTTMLDLVVNRIKPQVEQLVISANGDISALEKHGLPVIKDPIDGFVGPLAGILAGFHWAKENSPETSHIITIAADTPFFPTDYAKAMLDHANRGNTDRIILAKSQGRFHPIFGLWPISLAEDLENSLNDGMRKIRAWTGTHNETSLEFQDITINSTSIDPFFNVNEPGDLEICERLLS